MAEPYIGEIKLVPYTFVPRGWAFCDGQILPVSENQALFALLGTTYGGDGRTTFGLPDLRGRVPMGEGSGPGLSLRPLGTRPGYESIHLNTQQLPEHKHGISSSTGSSTSTADLDVYNGDSDTGDASNAKSVSSKQGFNNLLSTKAPNATLSGCVSGIQGGGSLPTETENAGTSQAQIPLVQPSLVLNYIIAITGVFPSRN